MTRGGGQSQEGGDQLKEAPLRICHPQELVQERGWVGGGEAGAGPHGGGLPPQPRGPRPLSAGAVGPLRGGSADARQSGWGVPLSPGGWLDGPGRPLAADYAGGAYEGDQGGAPGEQGSGRAVDRGDGQLGPGRGELCDRGGHSPGGNVISRLINGGTSQAREAA